MKEDTNLNITYGECIKSYDKFNETVYVNICTGEKEVVPWGIDGWLIFMFFIAVTLFLIGIGISCIIDYFSWR